MEVVSDFPWELMQARRFENSIFKMWKRKTQPAKQFIKNEGRLKTFLYDQNQR